MSYGGAQPLGSLSQRQREPVGLDLGPALRVDRTHNFLGYPGFDGPRLVRVQPSGVVAFVPPDPCDLRLTAAYLVLGKGE